MTRDELIYAVQTRIDDVRTDVAIDAVSNPLVNEILDEQLTNAFKLLPIRFLPHKTFTNTITTVDNGLLYSIELPTDFLRLVRYKTNALKRPIMEADLVTEGSRDHVFMYHQYASGGNSRARGCITKIGTTKLLYNSLTESTLSEASYVAIPEVADIADLIIDPVSWYIASVALQILGELEASKNALSKLNEFLINN